MLRLLTHPLRPLRYMCIIVVHVNVHNQPYQLARIVFSASDEALATCRYRDCSDDVSAAWHCEGSSTTASMPVPQQQQPPQPSPSPMPPPFSSQHQRQDTPSATPSPSTPPPSHTLRLLRHPLLSRYDRLLLLLRRHSCHRRQLHSFLGVPIVRNTSLLLAPANSKRTRMMPWLEPPKSANNGYRSITPPTNVTHLPSAPNFHLIRLTLMIIFSCCNTRLDGSRALFWKVVA